MTSDAAEPTKNTNRGLRGALVVLCVVVGLSAAWGLVDALTGSPRVWGLFGFEVVTIVSCALGVLVGTGRIREAPALGAACVAGAVFAAATLGRFSAIGTRSEQLLSEGQIASRLIRDPMFEGRFAAAALMGAIAVLMALGRDVRSWRSLGIGALFAVPSLAAMAWIGGPGKTWLLGGESAGGSMMRVLVGVVGGVVLTLCAGIAVHMVIRAFELRLPEPPMPAKGKSGKKKSGKGKPGKGGPAKGKTRAPGARKSEAAAPNKSA